MEQEKTRIIECPCPSPYQDEIYGKGKRMHNLGNDGYKCTVCGRVKNKGVK